MHVFDPATGKNLALGARSGYLHRRAPHQRLTGPLHARSSDFRGQPGRFNRTCPPSEFEATDQARNNSHLRDIGRFLISWGAYIPTSPQSAAPGGSSPRSAASWPPSAWRAVAWSVAKAGSPRPPRSAPRPSRPGRASPTPSPTPSPSPTCSGVAPGFSCEMQQRIGDVLSYLAGTPGSIGIVLNDRVSGAVWGNVNALHEYPAASTMKLAMMTDLLERNAAGSIHLTSTDMAEMYQALNTSNDNDANALWNEYEDASFLGRIQAFGMTHAKFTASPANWGFMYCTAQDLDNLMNYVLHDAPASVRDYLVDQLQHVSAVDQQWGVWGAGPQNQPGNKDGWESGPARHLDHQHGRVRGRGPAIHPGHHVQPRRL